METSKSSGKEESTGTELHPDKGKSSRWVRPSCFPNSNDGPWLVFFSHGKKRRTHVFYNIQQSRIYHRWIPSLCQVRCCGFSQGWLFMACCPQEGEDNNNYYYYLLNPATMEEIALPGLCASDLGNGCFRCVLSSPPTGAISVLFLFHRDLPFFVHCRIRDGGASVDEWVREPYDAEYGGGGGEFIVDVVGVGSMVYGITGGGRFVQVDVGDPLHLTYTLMGPDQSPAPRHRSNCKGFKIVESNGELFFVCKHYAGRSKDVEALEVLKLDFSCMKWEKVRTIGGDRAFFLCEERSISCPRGGEASGIKGDSIYYLEWCDTTVYRFDMARETISVERFCLRGEMFNEGQWMTTTSV